MNWRTWKWRRLKNEVRGGQLFQRWRNRPRVAPDFDLSKKALLQPERSWITFSKKRWKNNSLTFDNLILNLQIIKILNKLKIFYKKTDFRFEKRSYFRPKNWTIIFSIRKLKFGFSAQNFFRLNFFFIGLYFFHLPYAWWIGTTRLRIRGYKFAAVLKIQCTEPGPASACGRCAV